MHEFSACEYAAIGRVVVSFTALEDNLAQAAVCLLHTAHEKDFELFDQGSEQAVISTLQGRLKAFENAYIQVNGIDDWIEAFVQNLSFAVEWRNAVCHGRWRRGSCGGMRLIFFQRDYVKKRLDPPDHCLQIDELMRMEAENNQAALLLADRFIRALE